MALIYFLKSQYYGNTYQLDDFFEDDVIFLPKTNPNRSLNVDMRFLDTETYFDTQISVLGTGATIYDYTHIYAPDVNKIYQITSASRLDHDTTRIYLFEDPLLANFGNLWRRDILIKKTNEVSKFEGFNDLSNIEITKSVEVVDDIKINNPRIRDRYALLFFKGLQGSGGDITFTFNNSKFINTVERFADMIELVGKYPPMTVSGSPFQVDFYLKVVMLTNGDIYQCYITEIQANGYNRIGWIKIENNFLQDEWKDDYTFSCSIRDLPRFESETEKDVVVLALPFYLNYISGFMAGGEAPSNVNVATFQNYVSNDKPLNLFDIKIVDNVNFDISYSDSLSNIITLHTNRFLEDWPYTTGLNSNNENPIYQSFLFLKTINKKIDITPKVLKDVSLNPLNLPPFKNYYLVVYGEKIKIDPNYFTNGNKIYLIMNINTATVNYKVTLNNDNNIIATGSFTNQLLWQSDAIDIFNQQNPTHKEQFQLKKNHEELNALYSVGTKITTGALTGALAGTIAGPLGTAGGALIGGVGAGLSAGFGAIGTNIQLAQRQKEFNLEMEGVARKPIQMYGDSSDINLQILTDFGIYWFSEVVLKGSSFMNNEFDLNGFPCNFVGQLKDLNFTYNDLYKKDALIVKGTLITNVKNNHVTNFINNKLEEGVIFLK